MKVKLTQFADGLVLEFERKGTTLSFLPRSAVLGRDEVFSWNMKFVLPRRYPNVKVDWAVGHTNLEFRSETQYGHTICNPLAIGSILSS